MLIGLSFITLSSVAQQTQPLLLNLQKVLELGKADNLTIKLYRQKQQLAAADLTKAREWWLPELNVGAQTHWLRGSDMNSDGRVFEDVNRNNLWLGFGAEASWDIGNEIFEVQSTKLMAEAAMHLSRKAKNDILLKSIEAYFDLLLADVQIAAYRTLLLQSDTILQQLKAQVDVGLRYESELLLAQSAKAQLQVKKLTTEAERTESLSRLMMQLNLDPTTDVRTDQKLLAPLNLVSPTLETNMNEAISKRPEINYFGLQRQALIAKRKTFTTGLLLPRIDLQFYGSAYGSLYGANTSQLRPTGEMNAAILWDIPLAIFSGGNLKRSKTLVAISDLKLETEKQRIRTRISAAQASIMQMKKRMEIADMAQQFASQALSQSAARERLGTAKPFEVFEAQKIYISARMQYLKAIADHNKEQYRLFVGAGNDL